MLAQLSCTRRKWVDFFAFDPRIKDESKRHFLRRFEPEPKAIGLIEIAATQFLSELDDLWEQFITA
jgi:hypothetical protein